MIVDKLADQDANEVRFGARVEVKDMGTGDEEAFELVGPGDEDYSANKILITSPVGQGLVGKKRGDVVEIQVPMGKIKLKVLDISYP